MSERLTKLIDKYADMKRGVERRAWTIVVIGLVLAAASRSPQFTFKDPTGMVVGEAHNGYIVVFGLPIVFGLFWYFQSAFMETLSFARLVRTPAGDEKLKDSEVFLLRPPFTLTPGRTGLTARTSVCIGHLFVFGIPVICCATLFYDFLELRRPGFQGRGWADLFFGVGGPWFRDGQLNGFSPRWDRANGKPMPWIYPPFQTWLYVIAFVMAASWAAECYAWVNPRFALLCSRFRQRLY
jgi:hypothetical protein